ncbi:MAG: putative hydro-lyase [Firmicutes bacterium]|nr:putative hydro-lyase [Bacillota bacterium]
MRPEDMSLTELRQATRRGDFTSPTPGLAPGYAQANLAIFPQKYAFDFLLFSMRNPKPCPILDVTEPGSPVPRLAAPEADLRTDLPKYRIWERGELVDEVTDITPHWREDLVAFLLGCSFTFEAALLGAGIPIRHIEENRNVPMYITNIQCTPAGKFHGPVVVSMRPIPPAQVVRAVQVTSRYPAVHGAPIHVGDPSQIGIADINKPDLGEAVTINPGEVPVFWACGCTPQAVAMEAKPDFMITHAPGHMFITDLKNEELAAL